MADDGVQPVDDATSRRRSVRKASVNSFVVQRNAKLEKREKVKKISEILKKAENERTVAEKLLVKKNPDIVKASQNNAKRLQATKDRVLEIEDEPEDLTRKCDELADLIGNSSRIVVYTGAGISTAASIPDYRGPNGVWTLLKKGQALSAQDLSDAEPTFTHMSITKLFRTGRVKHVVSQNCDGLHIRSGYPRYALSEVHGNMFIECCYNCEPHREYIRLFDVTEKTGVRRHTTSRKCRACGKYLTDTIVHFGEKGKIKSPYRWKEAVRAAKGSDLILCLGSSLKILRRYTCLWCMDKRPSQRPKLVIVNLQWTPKDDTATLKINGRCDEVMRRVMEKLEYNVPEYRREFDPIFKFCTPLRAAEKKTTTKKILVPPIMPSKDSVKAVVSKSSKSRRKSKKSSTKSDKSTSSLPSPLSQSSGTLCDKDEKKEDLAPAKMLDSVKSEITEIEDGNVESMLCNLKSEEGISSNDTKYESLDYKIEHDGVENTTVSIDLKEKQTKDNNHETLDHYSLDGHNQGRTPSALCSSIKSSPSISDLQCHTSYPSLTKTIANDKTECKSNSIDSSFSLATKPTSLCAEQSHRSGSLNCAKNLSSFPLNRNHMSIADVTTTKQNVSCPPQKSQVTECLRDVCSLDFKTENSSAFSSCLVELPTVNNKKMINSKESGKKEDQPLLLHSPVRVKQSNDIITDFSVVLDSVPTTVVVDLEMMDNIRGGDLDLSPPGPIIMIDLDTDKWSTGISSSPAQRHNDVGEKHTNNAILDVKKSLSSTECPQIMDKNISSLSNIVSKSPPCISLTKVSSLANSSTGPCSISVSDPPKISTVTNSKILPAFSTFSTETTNDKCHISSNSFSCQLTSSSKKQERVQQDLTSPLPSIFSPTYVQIQQTVTSALSYPSTNLLKTSGQKPVKLNPPPFICSLPSTETITAKCHAEEESLPQGCLRSKNVTLSNEMSQSSSSILLSLSSSSSSSSTSSSLSSFQIPYNSPKQNSTIKDNLLLKSTSTSSLMSSPILINHLQSSIIPKRHINENNHCPAKIDSHEKITGIFNKSSESDAVRRNNNICKSKLASNNVLNLSPTLPENMYKGDQLLKPFKQAINSCPITDSVLLPQQNVCSSSKFPVTNIQNQQPRKETISVLESSESGIASCVLNMDDLLSTNNLPTYLSNPAYLKAPEKYVMSVINNSFKCVSPHSHAVAQKSSFSPETQTPNQATTLISKITAAEKAHCSEDGETLSENTDVPFKENRTIEHVCPITRSPSFVDSATKVASAKREISPLDLKPFPNKNSDPVSWRCIQKPSNKRSPNRNTIVLKADWGTPLTTFLPDPPVPVRKDKTCTKNGKMLKRSVILQENSLPGCTPSQIISSNKDPDVPAKKKAKRTPKPKCNKVDINVKEVKKRVVSKRKKSITTNKLKTSLSNPSTSLPGWFGKGLAIKRKSKKKS